MCILREYPSQSCSNILSFLQYKIQLIENKFDFVEIIHTIQISIVTLIKSRSCIVLTSISCAEVYGVLIDDCSVIKTVKMHSVGINTEKDE